MPGDLGLFSVDKDGLLLAVHLLAGLVMPLEFVEIEELIFEPAGGVVAGVDREHLAEDVDGTLEVAVLAEFAGLFHERVDLPLGGFSDALAALRFLFLDLPPLLKHEHFVVFPLLLGHPGGEGVQFAEQAFILHHRRGVLPAGFEHLPGPQKSLLSQIETLAEDGVLDLLFEFAVLVHGALPGDLVFAPDAGEERLAADLDGAVALGFLQAGQGPGVTGHGVERLLEETLGLGHTARFDRFVSFTDERAGPLVVDVGLRGRRRRGLGRHFLRGLRWRRGGGRRLRSVEGEIGIGGRAFGVGKAGKFREAVLGIGALGLGRVLVGEHVVEEGAGLGVFAVFDRLIGLIEVHFGLFDHGDGDAGAINVVVAQGALFIAERVGIDLDQGFLRLGVLPLLEEGDGVLQRLTVVGRPDGEGRQQARADARKPGHLGQDRSDSHGFPPQTGVQAMLRFGGSITGWAVVCWMV